MNFRLLNLSDERFDYPLTKLKNQDKKMKLIQRHMFYQNLTQRNKIFEMYKIYSSLYNTVGIFSVYLTLCSLQYFQDNVRELHSKHSSPVSVHQTLDFR